MYKRLYVSIVGFAYAVVYGFFTLFITGGGHGNFLWFMAFLITFFCGLFFPIAGFLVVDLRKLWARIALLTLLFLNLFATLWFFWSGLGDDGYEDLVKSWTRNFIGFIIFSAIHIVPVLVLWIITLNKIWAADSEESESDQYVMLP